MKPPLYGSIGLLGGPKHLDGTLVDPPRSDEGIPLPHIQMIADNPRRVGMMPSHQPCRKIHTFCIYRLMNFQSRNQVGVITNSWWVYVHESMTETDVEKYLENLNKDT